MHNLILLTKLSGKIIYTNTHHSWYGHVSGLRCMRRKGQARCSSSGALLAPFEGAPQCLVYPPRSDLSSAKGRKRKNKVAPSSVEEIVSPIPLNDEEGDDFENDENKDARYETCDDSAEEIVAPIPITTMTHTCIYIDI